MKMKSTFNLFYITHSLTMLLFNVFCKNITPGRNEVTKRTRKWIVFVMNIYMSFQCVLLSSAIVAYPTFIWFYAQMRSYVFSHTFTVVCVVLTNETNVLVGQ